MIAAYSKPRLWIAVAGALLLGMGLSATGNAAVSDMDITHAVENEILLDGAVSLNSIDISTSDGIVTLTGSVENILAKERAARLASIVKGTRSVVNQIAVRPAPARSDEVIEQDIINALLRDPATDSYEIEPSVENGVVTLKGTVDSWQERALAAHVAKGQDGVTGLENQIDVNYKTTRPDTEILNDIVQGLKWNALVDDGLIDVAVNIGNVSLSGTVGSAAEKQEAIGEAWVAGARSVEADELEVARWARDEALRQDKYDTPDAAEVEAALTDAFLEDPRVMAFNIESDVRNGTVTLRGTVDNLKAKRAAEQTARHTVGVQTVRNFIRVQPDATMADTLIEQHIADAMQRDPYVNRYDITISVLDGTAYLYGQVDSYFERGQADELAGRTPGVTEVRNYLSVADPSDPYYTNSYISPWTWYEYDLRDYTPRHTFRSDAEIQNDIEDQLFWSPFVDSDSVEVTVDDGEATLTGTVDSWSERAAATENAFEGGATWVDNDLNVQ